MVQNPQFEISPQVRQLAEKNVEQVQQGFRQLMDAARQAQDMMGKMLPHERGQRRSEGTPGSRHEVHSAERRCELCASARTCQRQRFSAGVGDLKSLRASPDSSLLSAGAGAWTVDGRGGAESSGEELADGGVSLRAHTIHCTSTTHRFHRSLLAVRAPAPRQSASRPNWSCDKSLRRGGGG